MKKRMILTVMLCLGLSLLPIKGTDMTQQVSAEEVINLDEFEFEEKTLVKYKGNAECVVIPSSVEAIGSNVFLRNTRIKKVVIPEGVRYIEDGTFSNCENLETVIFPSTLQSIGEYAFSNDKALKSIQLPEKMSYLGDGTFYGCSSLTSVTMPKTLSWLGDSCYCGEGINGVFEGCKKLKSIVIPQGITTLHENCFRDCTSLQTVTFPKGFKEIHATAFANCKSLKKLNGFSADVNYISLDAFDGLKVKNGFLIIGDVLVKYAGKDTKVSIPKGVKYIAPYAFKKDYVYYYPITSVNIPKGVVSIGANAFDGCAKLASISLPSGLKQIGDSSFRGCAFKTVKIPSSVTSIGEYAFSMCKKLASITIPSKVKRIGHKAFEGDTQLAKVKNLSKKCTFEGQTFRNCKKLVNKNGFLILGGKLYQYSGKSKTVKIPKGVKTIGKDAFKGNKVIISVTVPSGVETIEADAFAECKKLEKVTLPSSIKTIEDEAFQNCVKLKNVNVPEDISLLGEKAFKGCKALADKDGFVIVDHILFGYYGKEAYVKIPEEVVRVSRDRDVLSGSQIKGYECPESLRWFDLYTLGYYGMKQIIIHAPSLDVGGMEAYRLYYDASIFSVPEILVPAQSLEYYKKLFKEMYEIEDIVKPIPDSN